MRRPASFLAFGLLASLLAASWLPTAQAGATYACPTSGGVSSSFVPPPDSGVSGHVETWGCPTPFTRLAPGDLVTFVNTHPLNHFQEVFLSDLACLLCGWKLVAWGYNGPIGSFVVPPEGGTWVAWVLDSAPFRPFAVLDATLLHSWDIGQPVSREVCSEARVPSDPTAASAYATAEGGCPAQGRMCAETAKARVDAPPATSGSVPSTPADAYVHTCGGGSFCAGQRTRHTETGARYYEACGNPWGATPVCTREGDHREAYPGWDHLSAYC